MSCSTQAWFDVPDAEPTAKPNGAGSASPADLTEASLEAMLVEITRAVDAMGKPITVQPTHAFFRFDFKSHFRRCRQFPRMGLVSRIMVEDGMVPPRCIRGWSFYADYALVDRRRARRIQRQVREFEVKRRNHRAVLYYSVGQ